MDIFWKLLPVIVWGIDPDVVNPVPSNDGVNLIRYSLNHVKKLVANYAEVEYLLKVVALSYVHLLDLGLIGKNFPDLGW